MASRFVPLSLLLCAFAVPAIAQGHPGGGGNRGGTPSVGSTPSITNTIPSLGNAAPNAARSAIFLTGRVVIDDGTELTEPASIQSICQGQTHTEAYTDTHGNFSFQFGDPNSAGNGAFNDASSTITSGPSPMQNQRDWRGCELRAVLAGFTSQTIELSSRVNAFENTDLGRLPLHRMQEVEGSSISVTSALAPGAARKALQQGRDREKKQKWDEAEKSFEKAVSIYPKYAVAWYELGKVQLRRNDSTGAKGSFQKSVEADPKYVNPYEGLAQIAFQARQWTEVDDDSAKLLALNPVNFIDAYFMDGVANLYLRRLDLAEKVCRQGIRADGALHEIPKLHFLLATVLEQKHAYPEAADQLQQYIALTKNPDELAEARKQLDQIAKVSAQVTPAVDATKK